MGRIALLRGDVERSAGVGREGRAPNGRTRSSLIEDWDGLRFWGPARPPREASLAPCLSQLRGHYQGTNTASFAIAAGSAEAGRDTVGEGRMGQTALP